MNAAAASVFAVALAVAAPAPAQETAVFEGAWFSIDYPAEFTATPSLSSATGDGADSATFTAPDGSVVFYVFAPQWGGEPSDIAVDPERETLAAERIVEAGPVRRRWFTIAARDGSYSRSYLTTEDSRGPTLRTVGLTYRSAEALARWRPAYDAFRASLRQFGD